MYLLQHQDPQLFIFQPGFSQNGEHLVKCPNLDDVGSIENDLAMGIGLTHACCVRVGVLVLGYRIGSV